MKRYFTTMLMVVALCGLSFGCFSRMFSEGAGSATGASGKSVDSGTAQDFSSYHSLHIEPITVARGLQTPAGMSSMIRSDLVAVADKRGLGRDREPALRLSGEIVHYESGSTIDTVLGPLEEVVVRAVLTDVQTGQVVGETNLIGRSKATSSSGAVNLSAGVGKALNEWLGDGGQHKPDKKVKV